MTELRERLESGDGFLITCELVPGRGFRGKEIDAIFRFSDAARDSGLVHAVSLTDNAGGNPAILTEGIARELAEAGVQVIMPFSAGKDMSRNLLESRAYSLMRQGIRNLLVVTGDYPATGTFGLSKPVFDIDSVSALALLDRMNHGLEFAVGSRTRTLEKTDFFLGAVASPFKWTEASSLMQYSKLRKKAHAGARFVITQLGFDSWKHAEFIACARRRLGLSLPILGSVYLLTAGAARVMSRGEIPGAYVGPELLARVEAEAQGQDKGRGARLERAALQVAMLKGLGYQGAHIEGLALDFEDVRWIIHRSEEVGGSWRGRMEELRDAPPRPFYSLRGTAEEWMDGGPVRPTVTPRRRIPSPVFWLSEALHWMLFREGTAAYRVMQAAARFAEPRRGLVRTAYAVERLAKRTLFDCRECGDCALPETRYLCPESQCPKGMRNGPCGGSRVNGMCEVFPDTPCIWERIYWRAKRRGKVESLDYIIPPRDWRLYKAASWLTYYLQRDHSTKKLTLAPPETGQPGTPVPSPPGKVPGRE